MAPIFEHQPPIIIDQSSFRVIYDLYYEPICRFLNHYTRDRFAIEDVVQEIFVKLWENKDFLEVQHIKTYLYNAARNKMLNYLRNEANQAILLEQWSKEKSDADKSWDCYDLDEFSELLKGTSKNSVKIGKKLYRIDIQLIDNFSTIEP
jgi:RNA polymerase sigma-70 factor (ECF subfamily)